MTKLIRFENLAQAILFETEILDQISDGFWENSSPNNHYKSFSGVKVTHAFHAESDGAIVGKNFHTMRRYNFANAELLDCVGYRMITAVRFFSAFPNISLDEHWDYPESLELMSVNEWAFNVFNPKAGSNDYYVKRSERIRKNFPDVQSHQELSTAVMVGVAKFEYDMKQMKKDLKAMSALVNA